MKKQLFLNDDITTLLPVIAESPVPMALFSGQDNQITMVNQAWLNTWAKDESVINKTVEAAFPEWKNQPIFEHLKQVSEKASFYEAKEEPVLIYDKENNSESKCYFNINFKPLFDKSGNLWAILHTCTDVSEVVRARKRADEAEKHIQFILDSADMGSWDIDISNKTVWWDAKCRELLGDLKGNSGTFDDLLRCIDPHDTERFSKALELISSIAAEKTYSITIKTRRTNLSPTKWLECKGRAYYDDDGTINRFAGILHDITAKTLIEKEQQIIRDKLALSDQRFRDTIEQAPVAIGIFRGNELVIEEMNEELIRLWDRDKSILGKPLVEVFPEVEKQGFPKLMLNVYHTGQAYVAFEREASLIKDGVVRSGYFNFVYTPVKETSTSISGVMLVATDVTEQVKARLKLLSIENRFRDFILESPIPTVFYVGPEMHIEIVNDAMLKICGKDATIAGKTFNEALPELHDQPFQQILADVYSSGKAYYSEQLRAVLRVGEKTRTFWFNAAFKPVLDEQGNIFGILNMAVDITSQVQLQQQKDDFLGVASHELKTPVTSILAYTQLLERSLVKNSNLEQARMVEKLHDQVNRLTHLINDLLDVTRFHSGTLLFNEENFSFNQLILEIGEELQRISETHSIRISLDQDMIIHADRERIGQVIINLITNAIKYSPGKKEILISSVVDHTGIIFNVQDFGIGIPADKQAKVFEQFYRVSGQLEHTFPGMGLGLFISSQIISRAGGRMWVDSTEGIGSTFSFHLPNYNENKN
ncbi:PAS domain S-box-containing protein [bacterium A37T11]|nr:PAS domain S-box-containing protein [bacterium A37T11]